MKITIESTDRIIQVQTTPGGPAVPCRLWEGQTDKGVKVQCLVTRVAAHSNQDLAEFERDLQEHKTPELGSFFPLRLIL